MYITPDISASEASYPSIYGFDARLTIIKLDNTYIIVLSRSFANISVDGVSF